MERYIRGRNPEAILDARIRVIEILRQQGGKCRPNVNRVFQDTVDTFWDNCIQISEKYGV